MVKFTILDHMMCLSDFVFLIPSTMSSFFLFFLGFHNSLFVIISNFPLSRPSLFKGYSKYKKNKTVFFFWSFLAEGYFNYSWYKFSILNVYLIKLICNTHRVILSCSPSKMCLFQAKKALTENDLTMPFRQVQRKTSKKCGALQWANTVNEKMFLITKCLFLLWPLILLYCMNI